MIEPHAARAAYMASDIALANDNVPVEDSAQRLAQGANNMCAMRMKESENGRAATLLRMAGYSVGEIAEQLRLTPPTVAALLRQPWARQRLVEHLHKSKQNLLDMLETEAAQSVLTLVALRDDMEAPKAVRRQAADSLLDRYLGKAPQTVNLNKADVPSNVEDAERQLVALRAEETRLRGN